MTDPTPAPIPSQYVVDLRVLGTDAQLSAQGSLARLADEVTHRIPPNVHRYQLLARQQHIALLAATVAAALEDTETGPDCPPLQVAEGVCAVYRMTHHHTSRPDEDVLNRALAEAIDRVLDTVREVQQEDADRLAAEHEARAEDRDAESSAW